MEAFETSFDRLAALARARAGRILGSPHDAEEVAQEALLRAHSVWDTVEPFAEQWVSRVSTNLALGRLRRRTPVAPASHTADDTASANVRLDVCRALDGLPRRQREAVVLRHVLDLSERDAAEAMGCTAGAVKRHLHRAMEALRGAPSLAAFRTDVIETFGENLMTTWQDYFTAAVEPDAGWPPRPWDHRLIRTDTVHVDRIAVDATGRPVVDADGDEVFTGPGMDHVPVKHLQIDEPDPIVGELPQVGFDAALTAALERARAWAAWHGHTWVGTEHVLLAVLETDPAALDTIDGLDTDLGRYSRAVAEFYEGPFAGARVAIVEKRRSAGWRPQRAENEVEPEYNGAVVRASQAIVASAVEEERLATPADFVRHLLDRYQEMPTLAAQLLL